MDVTLITPTIPERGPLLERCMLSVASEAQLPVAHFIGMDWDGRGPARVRNDLARGASTEWVAFLDDDDYTLGNHFSSYNEVTYEADVIWTWCEVICRGDTWNPNSLWDPERLRAINYIPVAAAVRTALFHQVGGFDESVEFDEDWHLWRALQDAGARFVCNPVVTWHYMFRGPDHESPNRSLGR